MGTLPFSIINSCTYPACLQALPHSYSERLVFIGAHCAGNTVILLDIFLKINWFFENFVSSLCSSPLVSKKPLPDFFDGQAIPHRSLILGGSSPKIKSSISLISHLHTLLHKTHIPHSICEYLCKDARNPDSDTAQSNADHLRVVQKPCRDHLVGQQAVPQSSGEDQIIVLRRKSPLVILRK